MEADGNKVFTVSMKTFREISKESPASLEKEEGEGGERREGGGKDEGEGEEKGEGGREEEEGGV